MYYNGNLENGTSTVIDIYCFQWWFDDDTYKKTDFEIMQYTGKKDINNKEIYGKDIIIFDWKNGFIKVKLKGWLEYNEDELRWEINIIGNNTLPCLSFNFDTMSNFEIINNICENPEFFESIK
jgi:uncharacterized phage protein (TIGR01671 family)